MFPSAANTSMYYILSLVGETAVLREIREKTATGLPGNSSQAIPRTGGWGPWLNMEGHT